MRRIRRASAASLLFFMGAAGAQEPPPGAPASSPVPAPGSSPRPNLVLVTIDTLRADHVGCYGYFRATSPNIDRLAAESILFERCYATIPFTTPSHISILTAVFPLEHGVVTNSFHQPESVQLSRGFVSTDQLRSYPEILASHGWRTGGFVSGATVKRATGLAAGFEAWSEPEELQRPGRETLTAALAWLDQTKEDPFFLWLHLFDVHGPHEAELPHASEYLPDAALLDHMHQLGIGKTLARGEQGKVAIPELICTYDASIRLVDDLVAELRARLEQAGVWERTSFVLTSDHGEGLGQHRFLVHGPTWNEQLRVPLIVRVAGHAPARCTQLVSSVDLLPTVLALTPGLPREELMAQARGRDALAPEFEELPVFSMSPGRRSEFALTSARWKLIHRAAGEDALYDLASDPHETKDLKTAEPKVYATLKARLLKEIEGQRARNRYLRKGAVDPSLTPEEEERLRKQLEELGYADDADDDGTKPAAKPAKGKKGGGDG